MRASGRKLFPSERVLSNEPHKQPQGEHFRRQPCSAPIVRPINRMARKAKPAPIETDAGYFS